MAIFKESLSVLYEILQGQFKSGTLVKVNLSLEIWS